MQTAARRRGPPPTDGARRCCDGCRHFDWPKGVLLNVNIPAVSAAEVVGIEITRQGRHKIGGTMIEGVDPRGQPYFWIAGERQQDNGLAGTDLAAVHAGAVSITPLCLELTHEASMGALAALFR